MPSINLRASHLYVSATLFTLAFGASAFAQAPGDPPPTDPFGTPAVGSPSEPSEQEPFTGTLTLSQKGGSLYYKIYIVEGEAIGGYDTWRGRSMPYHRVVGGWFDGERMTLLMQSTQDDLKDKWHSHAHHFRKAGDEFVIEQSLYGEGQTIESGEVYQPHVLEERTELTAEEVRRLADSPSGEPATDAQTAGPERSTPNVEEAKRAAKAERENERLKSLVADLLLENDALRRRLDAR